MENQETNQEGIRKNSHTTLIVLILLFIAGLVLVVLLSDVEKTDTPAVTDTTVPDDKSAIEKVQDDPALAGLVSDGIGEGNLPDKEIGITVDATIGTFFTHPETGRTLYTITAGGKCAGDCLLTWDPYLAEDEVSLGDLTTVFRDDLGRFQYAWKGQLLYTYANDEKAGDFLGDGLFEIWHIARP